MLNRPLKKKIWFWVCLSLWIGICIFHPASPPAYGEEYVSVTVLVRDIVDTDKDGMPDWWETQYGLNPDDLSDALSNLDGDDFFNLKEFWMGSDPTLISSPSVLYVDINNAAGPWDGSQAYPFKIIQDAINYAMDATLVKIAAGSYYENLLMKEKVSLEGENNITTIIDGGSANSAINFENIDYSLVENLTIRGGNADFGAGIYCYNSAPTILKNIITANSAISFGGGIGVEHWSSPFILANTIKDNTADDGGGIYSHQSFPVIVDNILYSNAATYQGGAIFAGEESSCVITNDTLVNNTATNSGGGIHSFEPAISTITNCILWANTDDLSQSVATYSNIEDGDAGEGNISQDPLFADAPSQDYHLSLNSPCINAGSNTAPNLPLLDIDNQERIINEVVDMGADEYAVGIVSGKVILQARTNHSSTISFELRNAGETIPINTYQITTETNGSYVLDNIAPGTYDLTAKGSNFLREKQSDVLVVVGQETTDIDFELLGGDADNNNAVSPLDASILSAAYGSSSGQPNWDSRADFDNNGVIAPLDASILSSNFGKSGAE